jgi:ubiquinol-cytochrome c reductase cytochrome c1 subunit
LNLAMPAPLTSDGQVTYAPGNPAPTVDQMAKDVSAFLVWTAEPKLARRHASGVAVVIFLLVATALGYFAYQNVWRQQKAKVRMTGVLDPENQAKTRRAKGKAGIKG